MLHLYLQVTSTEDPVSGTAQRSVLFAAESDQKQAGHLIDALAGGPMDSLVVSGNNEQIEVAPDLVKILRQVVEVMARGGTVVVSAMPDELTTTVAAEQLGVSRPTLMKMIDNGEVQARKVGSHHRLKADDVQQLKRARLQKQRKAFDELRQLEEELDRF